MLLGYLICCWGSFYALGIADNALGTTDVAEPEGPKEIPVDPIDSIG